MLELYRVWLVRAYLLAQAPGRAILRMQASGEVHYDYPGPAARVIATSEDLIMEISAG